MGNTFEVWSWEKGDNDKFYYHLAYSGEDMAIALSTMFNLKNKGIWCIKFLWRGGDNS